MKKVPKIRKRKNSPLNTSTNPPKHPSEQAPLNNLLMYTRRRPLLLIHVHDLDGLASLIVRSIEDDCHLLQTISSRLWVVEIGCQTKHHQDHDEHNIIFPSNLLQSNGVHEGIKEDGADGGYPCHCETTRAEAERPDFARVSGEEGSSIQFNMLVTNSRSR